MEYWIHLFKTDIWFRGVCLVTIIVVFIFCGTLVQWFCGVQQTSLIMQENRKVGAGTKVSIRTILFSVRYEPVFPPGDHTSSSSGTGGG